MSDIPKAIANTELPPSWFVAWCVVCGYSVSVCLDDVPDIPFNEWFELAQETSDHTKHAEPEAQVTLQQDDIERFLTILNKTDADAVLALIKLGWEVRRISRSATANTEVEMTNGKSIWTVSLMPAIVNSRD